MSAADRLTYIEMRRSTKSNILIVLGAAVVVFGIAIFGKKGGKGSESGPEKTLTTFYENLYAGDFSSAESLCDTLSMGAYLETFRCAWDAADKDIIDAVPGILAKTEIEITDIEKDGQTRTVFYTMTAPEGRTKEKIAELRKEEGEWIIATITDRH